MKALLSKSLFFLSFFFLLAGCTPGHENQNFTDWTGNLVDATGQVQTDAVPMPEIIDGQRQHINENTYLYYYGQTCSHCKKIEDYLKASGVDQRIHIIPKEVQMNRENLQECLAQAEALNIPSEQIGTPFIVVQVPDGADFALIGEEEVLTHFQGLEAEIRAL